MNGYNIVLIEGLPLRKVSDGHFKVEGSLLPIVVEELVSRSAISIAIRPGNVSHFIDELPEVLKRRVQLIDDSSAFQHTKALLNPISEEFEVVLDEHGALVGNKRLPKSLDRALTYLFFELSTYLLGMQYQLQVDIDLERFQKSIKIIKDSARNPDGRAVLAALLGILRTYRKQDLAALAALPDAKSELVELFSQLIEDQTYIENCANAYGIGFPGRLKRCLVLIRRGCESIVSRKPFKQMFNLGSRAVEAATCVPMPNSEVTERLLKRDFLPPMVKIRPIITDAIKMWEKTNPDLRSEWWGI